MARDAAVAPAGSRGCAPHAAPSPSRPRVLGGTRARGVVNALACVVPPSTPALVAAAASRLAALRERAALGALAGALAGAFTNGVLHPLDTVKVQLQLRGSPHRGPGALLAATAAEHGRLGAAARLYRGAPSAVLGSAASSALYFGMYDAAKAAGLPPPLAALLGNALSSVVLVPKEVIKSRLQAGAPGGAGGVLAATLRTRGLRGLYAGYVPTLLRNAPSNIISFSAYEGLRALALRRQRRRGGAAAAAAALPAPVTAAAGALAGSLAAVATHPLDLVKTRLQTQGLVAPRGVALYKGVGGTLRAVLAAEGVRGLGRGLTTRLAYNALFSALGFAAFETAKRGLAAQRQARAEASAAEASRGAAAKGR